MTHIRTIIRKGYLTLVIVLMAVAPIGTLANASADDCTPPPESSYGAGVHRPSGAESKAFTFQCGDENPYVGLWTSDKYVYYPTTNNTQPKDPIVYYYNNDSGKYDYTYWAYVTTTNSYKSVDASVNTPPAGAKTVGAPAPKPATPPAPTGDDGGSSEGATAKAAVVGGGNAPNSINSSTNNNGNITNNTGVNVTNTIGATATSGNATVLDNTHAGNATSGDVSSQADVTNMLQSSSNALGDGSNVATFTYTIDGDVTGDLFFDPDMINDVQGDSTINSDTTNNLVINNNSDATITNNLTLASTSGDATVANNTNAGSATSGNARSVANIVNLIRSAITSGKSFVGTINITGNLNGDILLPANFVDTLIADNTPTVAVTAPGSTNSNTSTTTNNTTVTNTNNQGINNTVNSNARTGDATVDSNSNAGSAKSGTAKTNLTAFNLTGSKVVARNSILVYVNVLGKWTGLIVNAPPGATAAQLGGNVTENSRVTNNTTVNNTNNQQINNNVNVNATSGDATVARNTNAGDATAGNAETAVNLSNIEDSTFDLSGWFGILYINVFGTWNGSFGMNTSAGDVVGGKGADDSFLVGNVSKLVHYAPAASSAKTTPAAPPANTGNTTSIDNGTVLAAHTTAATATPKAKLTTPKTSASANLWLPAIGVVLGLAILGSERLFTRRHAA